MLNNLLDYDQIQMDQKATKSFLSFVHLLRERAVSQPNDLAYTFLVEGEREGEQLTFSQLDQKSRAIAASLKQAAGERVLLLYPSCLDYVAAFYGCLYADAVAVPTYPPKSNRNLGRLLAIIDDCQPKFALTTAGIYEQVQAALEQIPALKAINWVITDKLDVKLADDWRGSNASWDTLAFLQYTSGSTSMPKGVMVTHGNLLHNQEMMREGMGHDCNGVIVSWLPLFHDMGLIGNVLASAYNGVPCYIMSPNDFLQKPVRWLQAISNYRGTFSGSPNFGYDLCIRKVSLEQMQKLDLSSWKTAYNGAEPVRSETLVQFAQKFAVCGFRQEAAYPCYGLAEATLFVSGGLVSKVPVHTRVDKKSLEENNFIASDNNETGQILVSCGQAWCEERIAIVNPQTFELCNDGQVGEIWLSSESVAKGYWKKPEVSLEVFHARIVGSDDSRFLRTGDLGIKYQGELYIAGRLKDLIILRGRNFYPHDFELTAEKSHKALRPGCSAAFSVESDSGEILALVAEVSQEQIDKADYGQVVQSIRKSLATEHEIELSACLLIPPGTLPKTSSGKIQRSASKSGFLHNKLKTVYKWESTSAVTNTEPRKTSGMSLTVLEGWLSLEIASKLKVGLHQIDMQQPISTYGLDSLAAAELVASVEEKLGVAFNINELFQNDPTISQVAQLIQAKQQPSTSSLIQTLAEDKTTVLNGKVESDNKNLEVFSTPERVEVSKESPKQEQEILQEDRHNFQAYVNPELGRVLAQMKMDKVYVRGEGCYLYDQEGNRYLDFLAQYGALPFGFNHPEIWKAIEQVKNSLEPSFIQPSFLEAASTLAKRLVDIAPEGMRYVTFSNSGAEAVEAAIKLCRSTTGREGILAANNSFHGKTLGALSATDKKKYQEGFGAPVQGFAYVPYGDVEALERALASRYYAGFIVEPIQGEGGIIEPPAGYLSKAEAICKATGTLFIVDEIQTGLGRTGEMFASKHENIRPDIITLAKALGGGLVPIGACISRQDVYNEDFALKHTSTFGGNTLACRVGLATIDLLEKNDRALIEQVRENGRKLKEGLQQLKQKYPHIIGEVRGRGYMIGVSFGINKHNWGADLIGSLGETEILTSLVVSHMLNVENIRLGYTLNQGGVLRIQPPLTATWQDCEMFLKSFEKVLDRLEHRNTAYFTAHITDLDMESFNLKKRTTSKVKQFSVKQDDARFAFLLHPLTIRNYADVDHSLEVLSDDQISRLAEAVADNFDPFVLGDAYITSKTGRRAYGEFIIIPRTAKEFLRLSQSDALSEIRTAAKIAKKRGAKIIGLGAYTSVLTQGGFYLKKENLPPLTTGNSYTALSGKQAVEMALKRSRKTLSSSSVAVVGASGSIGRAISILLSQEVKKLILIGNPARPKESRIRMLDIIAEILQLTKKASLRAGSLSEKLLSWLPSSTDSLTKSDWVKLADEIEQRSGLIHATCNLERWLPESDVVITCTNAADDLITGELLKMEAIVCDISRPTNLCPDLRHQRPDVSVIDGGVVRLPEGSCINFNYDLDSYHAYACMAETMILALENRYEDTSLGIDLELNKVLDFAQLAERHGFQVVLDRLNSKSKIQKV